MNTLLGDWRWFWPETLRYFSPIPSAWDSSLNTGIGQSGLATLWISQYLNVTTSLTRFGIPWSLVALVFWQLPPLVLSAAGAFYAFSLLFPNKKAWGYVASLVYTCNTYFFLIYLGGQLGVALAYSVFPFVVGRFIYYLQAKGTSRDIAINGLLLGLLIVFDIRFAFIAVVCIGASWLYFSRSLRMVLDMVILPLGAAAGLHAYWILPLILFRQNPLAQNGVSSITGDELSFFSFADFSHALSLLHPNWPENIFGKTYFLQPEFLFIPLAAFLALSIVKEHGRLVRFFALTAVLGVFLSKGTQEPFGHLYDWLYRTVPGFMMFRDPTKFYAITAFSYAMLIPHTAHFVLHVIGRVSGNRKIRSVFIALLFGLWMWPLRIHAFRIVQSFKSYAIPEEYGRLTSFLADQPQFFRTLWIPQWQRFGYFSDMHPAIGRFEVLTDASASGQLMQLEDQNMKKRLTGLSVKYIIVPYDSEGELFLHDRRYDERQYTDTLKTLRNVSWLKEIEGFGNIGVFEVQDWGWGRFFFEDSPQTHISYLRKSATEYEVMLSKEFEQTLVFSEAFDPNWKLQLQDGTQIHSSRNAWGLNQFSLVSTPSGSLRVFYAPAQAVLYGLLITLGMVGVLFFTVRASRENREALKLFIRKQSRLSIVFASTLLSLATLEAGLRIIKEPLPEVIATHNYFQLNRAYGTEMKPHLIYVDNGREYVFDSHGFYSPEIEHEKRGVRIAYLGDSYTIGPGIKKEDNYPHLVTTRLQKDIPDLDYLVAGVGGHSPVQQLLIYLRKVQSFSPDVVVYSLYDNDLVDDFAFVYSSTFAYVNVWNAVPSSLRQSALVQQLMSLAATALSKKNEMYYERVKPNMAINEAMLWENYTRPALEKLHRNIKENGSDFVLFHIPSCISADECPPERMMYDETLRDNAEEWAASNKIPYISMAQIFHSANGPAPNELYFPEEKGFHLTERAASLVADAVEKLVRQTPTIRSLTKKPVL